MYPKTILSLRALCFKADEIQHYPIALYCDKKALLTERKLLKDTLKALEQNYISNAFNRLCYWVEELPLNQLCTSAAIINEELFVGLTANEIFRYFDHLPERPEAARISGWRFRRGDIVEVLMENCLSFGIIIDTPPQSASAYFRSLQEKLSRARGETQDEWMLRASISDNRYRVLLFESSDQLSIRNIPAQRLLQTFTLEASEQRELLQKRYIENHPD